MHSRSKYLRGIFFIALMLLFSSSFYLTIFGSQTNAQVVLNDFKNTEVIEETFDTDIIPDDNQRYTSNNVLSGADVWGQPLRITTERLQRNEYDVFQDESGIFHYLYIKEVTTHGMGLAYFHSTNESAIEWSLEEIIITIDATITHPKIIVDNDQNIHIAYLSFREDFYRVNYVNRSSSSSSWSPEQILNTTLTHTPSELTLGKTNTTVHLGWIFSEKGKTAQTWNSEIIFLSKANNDSIWTETKNEYFNSTNPLKMDFESLNNGSLLLLCTAWSEDIINNAILLARSDDFGVTWSNFIEVYEYNKKIGFLYFKPSLIANNYHVLFASQNSPKKIFYVELLENGTAIDIENQVSLQLADSYFAGIIENNQTKNVHVIYEEEQDEVYNIFQRTRLAGNTTWE
ncbi:MAG: hypothetical protein ACTSSB_14555, partial [Candidatus Heimdallarchaeota archaeon]